MAKVKNVGWHCRIWPALPPWECRDHDQDDAGFPVVFFDLCQGDEQGGGVGRVSAMTSQAIGKPFARQKTKMARH